MKKQTTYSLLTMLPWVLPITLKSLALSSLVTFAFFLYLNSTPNLYFRDIGISPNFETYVSEDKIVKFFESEFKNDQVSRLKVYRTANNYLTIKILSPNSNIKINKDEFLNAEKLLLKRYSIPPQNESHLYFYPELKNLRDHIKIKTILMFVLSFGFISTTFLILKLGKQIQHDLKK